MNLIEKATILHYHRHRASVFGEHSVERLGWKAAESQLRRFEIIASTVDFNGRSVLDIGCGCGDLKRFLDARSTGFSYTGVDLMPDFIRQAQETFAGAPQTSFFERDFSVAPLPAVDLVIASGALSYRSADPALYLEVIRKLYQCAREALIFNMLDAAVFPEHPLLTGHDVNQVMAACRALSSGVRLIRGYLEDDFTVVMS
jgi:SAM-dependent methyltransferase